MMTQQEVLEPFNPRLSEAYLQRFTEIMVRAEGSFPHYRHQLIQQELEGFEFDNNDIESVKYKIVLSVLSDLMSQGWELEIHEGNAFLKMTFQNSVDKNYVRYRLSSEKKAQLNEESVVRFIEEMEKEKVFRGNTISIRSLIGNKNILIENIRQEKNLIMKPYVQLVSKEKDEHTGYCLSDIWRYFRYTWSIPYKTMPGRNLFYLVRDSAQQYHPVIGIFALGNSVLNLSVRDDRIGWTVEAIQKQMMRRRKVECCEESISGTNGKTVKTKHESYLETEEEYKDRISVYSEKVIVNLQKNVHDAIKDIYVKDLGFHRNTKYPKREYIDQLKQMADELRLIAIDNEKNTRVVNYEIEAKTNLFKKKRALELSRLLEAVDIFNTYKATSYIEWLQNLLKVESGRKAINIALVANRKTKIGANMMEIIVCGAIPPYNELLGGKLVSILACSPEVIYDYNERYKKQISEIASRMKGTKVIRDSRLAFLGTTSLYSVGSSQYNRIKVPVTDDFLLGYNKVGITEGFGTVYFSKVTTSAMMRASELVDGGRRINNIFGEGTSPRFRLISRGLGYIGIKSDAFLQHYSPRIVYSIELAQNTNEFLRGETDDLQYPFNIENDDERSSMTKRMIDFWYERWLKKRLTTVDIIGRLQGFNPDTILVSTMR